MTAYSISLVVLSAFFHALWNFQCKTVKNKKEFFAIFKALLPIIIFPYYLFFAEFKFNLVQTYDYIIISGFLSFLGFVLIAKVYNKVDLSVAYPISRSQAIFVPLFSYIALGEIVSFFGIAGILIAVSGILILAEIGKVSSIPRDYLFIVVAVPVLFAFQLCIDKLALQYIGAESYFYGFSCIGGICFFGLALIRYDNKIMLNVIMTEWKKIISVCIFSFISFVFFLKAIEIANLSYATALRQLSFVFATILSHCFLSEEVGIRRIFSIILIIIGSLIVSNA